MNLPKNKLKGILKLDIPSEKNCLKKKITGSFPRDIFAGQGSEYLVDKAFLRKFYHRAAVKTI